MKTILVKFLDGNEIKGQVLFFNLNKPTFLLRVSDTPGQPDNRTIGIDQVKSIYFYKEFYPDSTHIKTATIEQTSPVSSVSLKLLVEFPDGEVIHGTAYKYNPNDPSFFLIPLNPASEFEKIFINNQAVKNVDRKQLLGKILVDNQSLKKEQLETALEYQQKQRSKKIGEILLEQQVINPEQLKQSLEKQRQSNMRLGEILISAGYITSNQLSHALNVQKDQRSKRLGQILVELKYITPVDICTALAAQLSLPWIKLSGMEISPRIAALVSEKMIKKYEVLPIEIKPGGILVVATAQPQDEKMLANIRKSTPLEIQPIIAYEGDIREALRTLFPDFYSEN